MDLKLIPYSGNLLREEIFANLAILLSEEIFAIFDFNLSGDFAIKILIYSELRTPDTIHKIVLIYR